MLRSYVLAVSFEEVVDPRSFYSNSSERLWAIFCAQRKGFFVFSVGLSDVLGDFRAVIIGCSMAI